MLTFGVYFVTSQINANLTPTLTEKEIEHSLKKVFTSKQIVLKNQGVFHDPKRVVAVEECDFYFCNVLTGGTEEHLKAFSKFKEKRPVILRTSRLRNSLAAAIEAKEYLMTRLPVFLVHESQPLPRILKKYSTLERLRNRIQGTFLTIGGSSSWLVSSFVDAERLKDFGIELQVESSEGFVKAFKKFTKKEIEEGNLKWELDPSVKKGDVEESLKSLDILEEMAKREKIVGMTIRCIDVIEDIQTSLCLPVSLMNDRGVPVSCEGDLRSLFGMVISTAVDGKPSFMGNLSDFDVIANTLTISHCTIAMKLCEEIKLKTHFETNQGVAIHGKVPCKKVTIFNVDVQLKNCVLTQGMVLKCPGESHLCRTQLIIKLTNMDYVFKTFGNHQIVSFSEDCSLLKSFCEYLGFKVFEIK